MSPLLLILLLLIIFGGGGFVLGAPLLVIILLVLLLGGGGGWWYYGRGPNPAPGSWPAVNIQYIVWVLVAVILLLIIFDHLGGMGLGSLGWHRRCFNC
jgi:hypothetical protein